MANDCDNTSIIIEDSVRTNYFTYLDSNARSLVFVGILNAWAQKLPGLKGSISQVKFENLKEKLLETFLAWIKLSLPEQVFENLVQDNASVLDLVFSALQSDDDDCHDKATEIVIELIKLARQKS
jgi:hypothetical protein